MKANFKVLIFLFSAILNLVFMGTFAVHKISIFSGDKKAGEVMRPIFLELDLTAEQLAQFTSERDKFINRLQEMGQGIGTRQIELIDSLEATPTDRQVIKKKQEEIQRLQAVVQDRVIAHFLQESSLLNPEQRTRFFRIIKARIETNVQICPPWMRSFGQCRPEEKQK